MSSDSYSQVDTNSSQSFIKEKTILTENEISKLAVYRALFANLGIAAIKILCWAFSGSSALLSEAIHSAADGFNSVCLLVGIQRGQKPADKYHPFGYGLEANIWALFASIFLFVGTGVALHNGWERLIHNQSEINGLLNNYYIVAVALIGSICFESWAVMGASRAVLDEAKISAKGRLAVVLNSIKYISAIKSPTVKFVWYEDTAALFGVIIAFIAITVSKFLVPIHQAHIPDAIASIMIGIILLSLAIYLIRYNMNSLTGASAKPQTEELIKEIAAQVNGVTNVNDLKTMDMGSSGLIINMEVDVDPEIPVKEADDIADKLEEKIREKIKEVSHVTIEVQAYDTREKWNEKFKSLIEEGKKSDLLNKMEAKMFSKFFDFTETVVKEIMIPRTDVTFIDAETSIDELIDLIITSGHTRIPVYKETIDDILGVVNAKDVLRALKDCDKSNIKIEDLTRELTIVPETKYISDMLNEFILNKSQIAAIVDEHGGVAGIVTVEDILEEIVGEIWDEYDVEVSDVVKISENALSIYSKMNIFDLNERFGLDFSTEDYQTIGGIVFGLLGREPEVGDEVEDQNITMKVESMDGHKIVRVLLTREEPFIDKEDEKETLEEEDGI